MTVTKLPAIVYHGGNRRWFTLSAACRNEAKAKIKTRCTCENAYIGASIYESMGAITCEYHEDYARFKKMVRRLARLCKRHFLDAQHEKA